MEIKMVATFEEIWWEEECDTCGEEVEWVAGDPYAWILPSHNSRKVRNGHWAHKNNDDSHDVDDDHSPSEEPYRIGGFTDPENPWGGFKQEIPEGLCGEEFTAWVAENSTVVTFDNVEEAAEFVSDFPGAVEDLYPECSREIDYRTGHETTVMLHVETFQGEVFAAVSTQ